MTNIVKTVWKILDNSPCILRDMKRGIINTRALASYLIKEKKIDASLDAVIGAIRRYKLNHYNDIFQFAHEIIGKTINISTKSKLAEISLVKDAEIQRMLPQLFEIIQYTRGDVLRIAQANASITILVDEKNLEKITELFPKEKIISVTKNLAEINMYINPKMVLTPGIIAIASNELAINGINIVEAMTCPPEMLWFIKEEDVLKAYHVLYQLCKDK